MRWLKQATPHGHAWWVLTMPAPITDESGFGSLLPTPTVSLENVNVLGVYQFGFTRDGLDAFLSLENVNVLGVYTGALIPDFITKTNEQLYIEDIVNRETSKTGLLLSVDRQVFDDAPETISGDRLDLVGHTLESEQPGILDFMSYYGTISGTAGFTGSTGITSLIVGATAGLSGAQALLSASTALQAAAGWTVGRYDTMTIYGPSASLPSGYVSAFATPALMSAFVADISTSTSFVKVGASATTGASANFSNVNSAVYSAAADTLTIKVAYLVDPAEGVTGPTANVNGFMHILATGATPNGGTASVPIIKDIDFVFAAGGWIYAGKDSTLYQQNLDGTLTDGDGVIVSGASYGYAQFNRVQTHDFSGATFSGVAAFGAETPIFTQKKNYATVRAYDNNDFTGATSIAVASSYIFRTFSGDLNESFEVWGGTSYPTPTNTVYFDNGSTGPLGLDGFTGQIRKGQGLVMNFGGTGGATTIDPLTGKSRLTKIVSVTEIVDPTSALYKKVKVVTVDPIYISGSNEVERYKRVIDFVEHYRFHVLRGYTLRTEQMPDGTATRENEILQVLYDTGIADALYDKEAVVRASSGEKEPRWASR
jgi:hypothetical protein